MPDKILETYGLKLLLPQTPLKASLSMLKRIGADYVLINTTFNEQLAEDYFGLEPSPEGARAFLSKFADHPELFKEIYREDGYYLFRVIESSGQAGERE